MARTAPRQPGPPAGVIFGCNRSSEEESLNGLFGMSSGHWSLVKEIVPGTPCFLFNFNTKELHGVFKAVSAGGWNLDPLAYGGKPKEGSMYPAQVRVEYCPRCPPMEERYFKPAIADNYFNPNRFRWELSERQVEELLDLFLGPGAPWPPRKNAPVTQRPSARPWSSPGRLEPAPRDGHAYNEHASSRGFAADHRPMLEGPAYHERSYTPLSPIESHIGKPISHMAPRMPESLAPRSLLPERSHVEYRERRPIGLPEELRLPRAPESLTDIFRPSPVTATFGQDVRSTMPMMTTGLSSIFGPTDPASTSLRGPSFVASRSASPQRLPAPPGRFGQQSSAQPEASQWDFSSTGHVGDQFTRLGTDTSILKEPVSSISTLPAELTISERFQQLSRHAPDQDAAHASSGPLRISLSSSAGRSVLVPQPAPAPIVSPVSQAVVSAAPDQIVTLVIGSIPHSCTINVLVSILDQLQKDHYDFLHYQPSEEFDSTAVVNFTNPRNAEAFQEELHDAYWSDLYNFDPPTSAIASVTPHTVQGKDALMTQHKATAVRFGGPPGNESRLPVNRPLFFYAGKKRPAVQDPDSLHPPSRPRLPSARNADPSQNPPAVQGRSNLYPDAHAHNMEHSTAVKMEPNQAGPAGFGQDFGTSLPPSPTGRFSRPASPSNLSEADRAHVRSRPGSAAAVASRPPPTDGSNPLKITIKQEHNMGQPVTPSPESALDIMPQALSALDLPSRGVSSSPNQPNMQPAQQEAAAFLQGLMGPRVQQQEQRQQQDYQQHEQRQQQEYQQHEHHKQQDYQQQEHRQQSDYRHRHRSPSQQPRSPTRQPHRQHSNRQHSSRSSREPEQHHASRHTSLSRRQNGSAHNGPEHRTASRGVHKISSRDHRPSSRSSRERDSSRRRKAADLTHSRNNPDKPQEGREAAAGRAFEVFVDTAPMYPELPGSVERDFSPAHDAAHDLNGSGMSVSRPVEEGSADSTMGLQQSEEQHADNSNAATAVGKQQQQLLPNSMFPAAVRHGDFGADFLAVPTSP